MPQHPTDPVFRRLYQLEGTLNDPYISPQLAMAIFENAADAMIIVNIDTRAIRFVNRMAEFLFGYHRSELVGELIEILVPDNLREQHTYDTRTYASQPRARPMAHGRLLPCRHRSGRHINANIMLSPVTVPEGQFVLATVRPYEGNPTAVRLGNEPYNP